MNGPLVPSDAARQRRGCRAAYHHKFRCPTYGIFGLGKAQGPCGMGQPFRSQWVYWRLRLYRAENTLEMPPHRPPLVDFHGLVIPGKRYAWGIVAACMVAWIQQASMPLFTLGSELSLASPSSEQLADTVPSRSIRQRKVADMSTDISLPMGILPQNVAANWVVTPSEHEDRRLTGQWAKTAQHWSATNLQYEPLYFEEVNLERYGYTSCRFLQPLISAARFFATIPALPYKMVLQRPCYPRYALGHYRPGSCAPWYWQRLPIQARAGLVEMGVVVGLIFLIP
jgi:hypothetical protein